VGLLLRVIFRTDASPILGYGHLMRCRSLAHALKELGMSCVMVGPKLSDRTDADAGVFEQWLEQSQWLGESDDASQLVALANQYGGAVLVLDDYRVGLAYQKVILEAGLKWLQFDGRAEGSLWADWVVNASPAARPADYARLLQKPGARALLGPQYAVLRPEFSGVTPRRHEKSQVTKVLVTFGGGDDRGAILFVLKALLPATAATIQFQVMTGGNNPRNPEIKEWIDSHAAPRVRLHVSPAQVAALFSVCDLAVMAGGTTTYEAAFCGLPMLILTLAANQEPQSQGWQDKGAAVYLGRFKEVSGEGLISHFSKLSGSQELREKMSKCGQHEVDGQGAEKIASMLARHTRKASNN
jgi:UDP-2,4-diacetamido-2,4,6-trideoxy-beta-L-altropyranose hydrolase